MKRAVLFLNGNKPQKKLIQKYISSTDYIICADRGAEYAFDAGITPDIILGDNDSISQEFLEKLPRSVKTETFPPEKDETDSELAITYAIKNGYNDLLIFGLIGDRVDHVLSNILILVRLSKAIQYTIIENNQTMYITQTKIILSGKPGEFISLIPGVEDVLGVSTEGLKYPLHNETLFFGKSRGISNEFIEKKAIVRLKKGTLIVIHTKNT